MATNLWIRTCKGRPAILVQVEEEERRFRVYQKERSLSKAEWDRLLLGPAYRLS
jgi:hypothetical protein